MLQADGADVPLGSINLPPAVKDFFKEIWAELDFGGGEGRKLLGPV